MGIARPWDRAVNEIIALGPDASLNKEATMNFSIRELSVLAYANGFTLWHYKAGDDGLEATAGTGFFDGAADLLANGDMVLVSSPGGGRVLCIAAAAGSVVAAPLC